VVGALVLWVVDRELVGVKELVFLLGLVDLFVSIEDAAFVERPGLPQKWWAWLGLVCVVLYAVLLGRAPGGGHAGRSVGQVKTAEDALDGGGERDEGDGPHLAAAGRAQEREPLAGSGENPGPEHAGGW